MFLDRYPCGIWRTFSVHIDEDKMSLLLKTLGMKYRNLVSFLGAVLGTVLIFSFSISRALTIDEIVYLGQYLPPLLGPSSDPWPWTVDAKQPLFFWILKFTYSILPRSLQENAQILLHLGRGLSAFYFAVAGVLVSTAFRSTLAGVFFLASPFVIVHAQIATVESLLIAEFALLVWGWVRWCSRRDWVSVAAFGVGALALSLTKTNGVACLLGFAPFVAIEVIRIPSEFKLRAFVMVTTLAGGVSFLLFSLASGKNVQKEAEGLFQLSRFTAGRILDLPAQLLSMHAYFIPSLAWMIGGFWLKCSKGGAFFRRLGPLILVSGMSLGMIIGLTKDYPRYYLFFWLPLILIFAEVVSSVQGIQLPVLRRLVGLALAFAFLNFGQAFDLLRQPAKIDSRIPQIDRIQYFDLYASKLLPPRVLSLLESGRVEVYGFPPPYGAEPYLSIQIGMRRTREIFRHLPAGDHHGPEKVKCEVGQDRYLLVDHWFFSDEDLSRVRDYQRIWEVTSYSGKKQMSLLRVPCPLPGARSAEPTV